MFKVIAQEGSVPVGQKGFHKQALWIFLFGEDGKPEPFPTRFDKIFGAAEKPYAQGEYQIHPSSFRAMVNEKGNKTLSLSRLTLVPVDGKTRTA